MPKTNKERLQDNNTALLRIKGKAENLPDKRDVKLFDTIEEMQADPNPQEGDLAVVYKEDVENNIFEGLYEATLIETEDVGKIYALDMADMVNDDFITHQSNYIDITDINDILAKTPFAQSNYKVADIVYTNNKYYIYPYYRFGATYSGVVADEVNKKLYFVAKKDDEYAYIKVPFDLYIYDTTTDVVTITTADDYTDMIMRWGNGDYEYYKITEILQNHNSFGIRYIKTSATLQNTLQNISYFNCMTLPMTTTSNVNTVSTVTIHADTSTISYIQPDTQIDCVKDFVGENYVFYGQNGVDTGTMQVLTYPYPYSEYHNYDYEFYEATVKSNVIRDDTSYVLASYQVVPGTKPDTWALTGNRKMKLGIPYTELARKIGLTADKIKAGVTILGITGTYTGE